ncbi:MAG: TolC family protein [Clostridia bacterium]|nr:TolC family protein [Clostridia bacterium]
MIRKITALLAATAIVLTAVPAFAQEEANDAVGIHTMEKTEVEKIELSLDGAIAMALEDNPRLAAADATIKSAEMSLVIAEETGKEYKDMEKTLSKIPGVSTAINVSGGLEQAYLKHGYYIDAAKVGVELATMSKSQVSASVAYEVTQKYYNAKLMERLVDIAQTGLNIAKDNLTMMENQFEAGYVPAIEVQNAKNAVVRAEYSLSSYKRNLELAKKSLKVSLQLEEYGGDIILTDEIEIPALPENADSAINSALESRYDMTAVKKDYELKTKMFEITKFYVTDKTAMYHSAYSEYLNAEYTYNNAVEMMKIALESEYAAILTAADEIVACENDLEVAQAMYESRKTMYDLGLITNLELTGVMAELDSSRMQLENARVNYALAVVKFSYSTTVGI